jgi:glycosyltransferase involved in cell wall biosynthesis
MIPHPLNNQFWPIVPQRVALEQLKLPENKTLLLFFGFIRPYKWLDNLLTILPQIIQKIPNAHLIIAGECFWSFQIYQNIIDSLWLKNHVTTRLFYIPSTDIPVYFGACDLLVMPYRHITNSGIESIASVYSKRFLLTVGVSSDELLRLIIESINQDIGQKKWLSWEGYVDKIFKFINHHA